MNRLKTTIGNKNSRLNRDAFEDLFNKHHNQVKINEFINA